jgi:hypothetical protein
MPWAFIILLQNFFFECYLVDVYFVFILIYLLQQGNHWKNE